LSLTVAVSVKIGIGSEVVAPADFEVVEVVRRRDLHATRAELAVDIASAITGIVRPVSAA